MNQPVSAQRDDDGEVILRAYRFLDEIGKQVEALTKAIKSRIDVWGNDSRSKINISKFSVDDELSESEWLYRSSINTFEIRKRGTKKNSKPSLYGAFQLSLAAKNPAADDAFFPHVAVLLADATHDDEWKQWTCEEFQLDEEFLRDPEVQEDDPWVLHRDLPDWKENDRWVGDHVVAFVVPLVALHNEGDVDKLIVGRLEREVKRLMLGVP